MAKTVSPMSIHFRLLLCMAVDQSQQRKYILIGNDARGEKVTGEAESQEKRSVTVSEGNCGAFAGGLPIHHADR